MKLAIPDLISNSYFPAAVQADDASQRVEPGEQGQPGQERPGRNQRAAHEGGCGDEALRRVPDCGGHGYGLLLPGRTSKKR